MTISLTRNLVLLGAGKMGTALLSSWVSGTVDPSQIEIHDPTPCEKAQALIAAHHIATNKDQTPAEVLVVAVKPQIMPQVLSEASALIDADTLVISIAAGQTLSAIENMVQAGAAVIRTMPNTPAEIGMGMTVACANAHVTPAQKQLTDNLLRAVGDVGWVEDESLMDAVTAISGSGPAYIFHFTECLTKAGIEAGLDEALAAQLARATVSGAGALMQQSGVEAGILRENVTSPGGTTAAALDVLMAEGGLMPLLIEAVEAAKKRAGELSS